MKEMVGGCCVCSDERGWPENPLVYCDGQNCTVAVHQACYGIVTVPTGPWYCRKCESQERSARVRCELCPSRDGALKKTDNQGWAHVVCALYIPEVRFGNVTTMEPIILQLIPQERYAKTCYICQESGKPNRATVGACMQCNKSNCKQQFHVTCAQSLGLLCEEAGNYLDNVKYCGYCQHHYGKLKKGGNVKTIPPYKPITHDTSSDSSLSPEKELDSGMNATASSTSATSIKITTNINAASTTKQRKSSTASKQSNSSSSSSNAAAATVSSSGFASSLHGSNFSNSNTGSGNINLGSVGVGSSGSNNSGNLSANNSSIGSGNSMSGGASASSTTNLKNSSNSSSSYKEKDKHSKNVNKTSSSSKEKDGSSSSSSSRDSREKSSKSSKNKEFSNNNPMSGASMNNSSTTSTSTALNMSSSMHESHSHGGNLSTQSAAQNLTTTSAAVSMSASGNSNSSNSGSKEAAKSSSTSNTVGNSGFGGNNNATDLHTSSTDNNNFGGGTHMDTATSVGSINVNSANGGGGMTSAGSKSSGSSVAKKRKADSKSNNNLGDDINSPFRDMIKDVSVTLTPLTDFEKEIEKSAKKQKTELSPPAHQTHSTDANSTQSGSNGSGNSSHNSASSGATSASISASIASTAAASTLSTATASHKYTLSTDAKNGGGGATNLSTSNVNSSASNAHKSNTAGSTNSNNNSGSNSNAQNYTSAKEQQHHRDDRYTTQAPTNSAANAASNAANAAANAPSLYVSVPLSTANVPGINLPTSSAAGGATDHHAPPSQSTRAAAAAISQQQQHQGGAATINMTGSNTSGTHATATTTALGAIGSSGGGGGAGGMLERQSPRIHHQPPALSEHHSNSNSSYFASSASGLPTAAHSSVIHQSGKSPSGNMMLSASSNPNLMATTTETGNLKISYEKQTTRVSQLQEQETAPVRRSRTPDSGIYSSSSFVANSSTVSNASSSSSSSSVGCGGLKFSYEPQAAAIDSPAAHLLTAVTTATASLNAMTTNITTTTSTTTIKDSPPSSPGSEIGAVATAPRKRGRKAKDPLANANEAKVDVKVFQNGGHVLGATPTTAAAANMANSAPSGVPSSGSTLHTAAHMLGNQLNPNSNVAQKLSDQLHMEIQDHSIYTADTVTPQFVGVPFPGKSTRNTTSTPISTSNNTLTINSVSAVTPATEMTGGTSLASMFGSGVNGNMSIPQSLEQLLERQWEQGSQFLMEQAQHFDIASLLSCLHQLQRENVRLEEHVTSLIARRDHLLAVNARLAVPLKTNTTQSQGK
uniref:Protein AF-10 n=1 Tax=Bactrocera latifrons TaxID=174628 RepID=A0A0K8UB93_BACLA